MNENLIHVALASDNNYFEGLLVTAWSIATSCSRAPSLVFHILDGGITDANWELLQSKLAAAECQIDRIIINQSEALKNYPDYRGRSKMTFARLYLPALLPQVNHIIYVDVDILWLANIASLWDLKDDENIMTVVTEHAHFDFMNKEEIKWFSDNDIPYEPERYFCTGMAVFNLEKMRAEHLTTRAIELFRENNFQLPTVDQTALNALLMSRADVKHIDHCWQITTGGMPPSIGADGAVIHYAGDTPWRPIGHSHRMLTDAILLWHKVHAHIRCISTWKSLRQCNTSFQIIFGRILYILSTHRAGEVLIHAYMRFLGKSHMIPYLDAFMRRTAFNPNIKILKAIE